MLKKSLCITMVLSMIILSACGAQPETEEILTAVAVSDVKLSPISNDMVYVGQVKSKEHVMVIPKIPGTVKEIYFDLGDSVNEGDVLFVIDDTDVKNQIKQLESSLNTANVAVQSAQDAKSRVSGGQYESQILQLESGINSIKTQLETARKSLANADGQIEAAKAGLDAAEKAYNTAKDTFENNKQLYAQGLVSKSQLDGLEIQYSQSKSQYDSALNGYNQAVTGKSTLEANVAQLEDQLKTQNSNYELVTGTIAGENLTSAQSGIAQASASKQTVQTQIDIAKQSLEDTRVKSPITGVVSQRNVDIEGIASNQAAAFVIVNMDTVTVDVNLSEKVIGSLKKGDTVEVYVDTAKEEPFIGIITAISPAGDNTSTFPAKIEIDNKDHLIKPGMFAELVFNREKHDNTIVLPRSSVLEDETTRFVYIIEDDMAKRVDVTTGIDNGKEIEILSGLSVGDKVIVKGQTYVSDSEKVNIVEQ